MEDVLNKKFVNVCEWFVGDKLPIHFNENKIKCFIFRKENPAGA